MKISPFISSCLFAAALGAAGTLGGVRAQAAGVNLLTNGSFETNGGPDTTTGTGWTFLGNVNYKTGEGATNGSYAAGYNGANTANGGIVYQTLTNLTPGVTYTVSLDYGNFAYNGPQQLSVEARNGAGYNAGGELINAGSARITATSEGAIASNGTTLVLTDGTGSVDNSGESEFNNVTVSFTALSNTGTLVLTDSGSYTNRSDLIVDNVSVVAQVPEPATWVAGGLSVGLLLAAQVRRRA